MKFQINDNISISGYVYKIRKASGLSFISLKRDNIMYQAVYIPDLCKTSLSLLSEGDYVSINGTVTEEKRSEHGFEITMKSFEVLSAPIEEYPFTLSQPTLSTSVEDMVSYPDVAVKHLAKGAIMAIRSTMIYAYTKFMQEHSFIMINTPKITASSNDNYISLKYFDNTATLAHSPLPYLITAAGGLDKVYEIGNGYTSKHSRSVRHLTEFTRMDFEVSYADSSKIRNTLTELIKYITNYIIKNHTKELSICGREIKEISSIPEITYSKAMTKLDKADRTQGLDPTDERKLCEMADSDYIYVTQLPPSVKHPYEKDGTGFVLLSQGIEIARGGEHISDYEEIKAKSPDIDITPYKYGLPPMGGVGLGVERAVMAILKLSDIREATFITRDFNHIKP